MRRLALFVVLLTAGCVAPAAVDPASVTGQLPDLAAPFDIDHDHEDATLHAQKWNAELVAHSHPQIEGLGFVQMEELDLMGEMLLVGVNAGSEEEGTTEGGFLIFDVTDPTAPAFVHYERSPDVASCIGDVKAGPGETQVTLATQCSRDPTDPGHGFVTYDVTDPASPVLVTMAPPQTSCHMVDVSVIGATSYVYCAGLSGANVWQFVDTPMGIQPVLVNPNTVREPTAVLHVPQAQQEFGTLGAAFLSSPHDMTTQPDPLTGDPIVIVSHMYAGIRILDGNDPTLGTVLGTWDGAGASDYSWIHTAQAVEMDGKRIVVAITENVVNTPPRFWVVDFTDYANPILLAEHNLAAQEDSQDLVYSLHNFQVVSTEVLGEDGQRSVRARMYMGTYHSGVWVLDLADPTAPTEIAYALSGQEIYRKPDGTFFGIGNNWVEQVWDVVIKDGYVLASDMSSGLHVYAIEGDAVGDAALRSFG